MKQCEKCGEAFVPKMDRQRFCTRTCSDAFYAGERRDAVKAFRGAPQDPLRAPAWSKDPTPPEPPHDGRDEGLTYDGRHCR